MFRNRGFIFRKETVNTGTIWYVLHAISISSLTVGTEHNVQHIRLLYTDACTTRCTIPVCTTVFLKMNPRVRNM